MILNPSHKITLQGLPSEILDAYVRYKKGSRAIVSWLVQYGPTEYKSVKTLPIKELEALAKSVTISINELPQVVHFHFRETIAARKRLSQFFRKSVDTPKDGIATINHEHFTTSLANIYSDLCDHCQKRANKQLSKTCIVCPTALAEPIKNHYACLPVEVSVEGLAIGPLDAGCDDCLQHEQIYQCSGPHTELGIENDEMSIAIETATVLKHIYETLTVVKSCWEEAGKGEVHSVAAAGTTNIAWATLRDLESQLSNDDEKLSLKSLHQRCCLFKEAADDSSSALVKVHTLLDSLAESDRTVEHYLSCHKLAVIAQCPSCVQKPSDYMQQTAAFDAEKTTSFSVALIDNILHLMCGAKPPTIIFQSCPIFAEIGYLLTHRNDKSTSFRCVLAIHLLATAYKAYLSALPNPCTVSTCRITALKLAKQASSTITLILDDKENFPCRCSNTLAYHLSKLKDETESYAKHRCWDLYFQSPWVAGNHIIEILDRLSYYGMHLLHYRHYVGALVHSYNVLIQLAGLEHIPFLEQLCGTFNEVFFPAGRPTSNFKNSWARYIGARLKFKKGHKRHNSERESWCMAVPAHAARSAAGLGIDAERGRGALEPKYDYARIDPLMMLKQRDWRVDLSAGSQPKRSDSASSSRPGSSSTSEKHSSPSLSETSSITRHEIQPRLDHESCHHPLISHLNTLSSSIAPNLATNYINTAPVTHPPTFSTSPLNLLRIFLKSLKSVTSITTQTHTEFSEKDIRNCICFSHTLLTAADRIVEGRRFGGVECWRKQEQKIVEIVKRGLLDGFGDGEGWVWEV